MASFRLFVVLTGLLIAGCGGNDAVLQSGKRSATEPQNAKSVYESELASVRDAKFNFLYVLRRRDGGVIDAEDRNVIRQATADMNRRVSADDGRAFIIGSNYQLPGAGMSALTERFAVEDLSPPPPPTDVNENR